MGKVMHGAAGPHCGQYNRALRAPCSLGRQMQSMLPRIDLVHTPSP